jgi:hypothetical protein
VLPSLLTVAENTTNPAAPIETIALVRRPAIRRRHCRSETNDSAQNQSGSQADRDVPSV